MRAQQGVVARRHEERVLRVPRRVVGLEVERAEVVVVVLDLGALGDPEAHGDEDLDDLVLHLAQRMDVAARALAAGERDVDAVLAERALELGRAEGALAGGERRLKRVLHLVGKRTQRRPVRGGERPETAQDRVEGAPAPEVADADRLQLRRGPGGRYLGERRLPELCEVGAQCGQAGAAACVRATSAMRAKASGWSSASAARILRSTSTPAALSPATSRL